MRIAYRRQTGVSLVELSIVLAIAGFLWGSVFVVQSVVERATAHKLVQELISVKAMLYAYRERYGAVPGDDGRAAEHLPGAVSASGGTASRAFHDDGLITSGNWQWATNHSTLTQYPPELITSPEPALFWNHVRHAKLAQGDPLEFPVYNAVHGYLGVGDDGPSEPLGVTGQYKVCSSAIDGHLAKLMDEKIDDGDATTGKVFAAVELLDAPVTSTRDAPSPYVRGKNYTVCMRF